MDEQLYKKNKNGRYSKIGYSDGFSGFPSDGIWLVQQSDGSKFSECIIKYEELETAKPAINLILGYKEKIIDFLRDNQNICKIYNISTGDFASRMLKTISKNEDKN